jgi:hypothetical protein
VREEFADIHPGLAVFPEGPRTSEQFETCVRSIVELEVAFEFLSVAPGEFGFGVEQVHMAWAALHEQGDHGLGAWLDAGQFWEDVMLETGAVDGFGEEPFVAQESEEAERTETEGASSDEMSSAEAG